MAWDFSTEPEFQEQLDWMRQFVREEIWPLETIVDELAQEQLDRVYAPLQERGQASAACGPRTSPDLGGQGFGQLKLGLMHEILGTSAVRAERVRQRRAGLGQQRDPRARRDDEQKERWLYPLLAGDLQVGVLDDRARAAGLGPDALHTRRCATATSGSSTATSGSRRTARSPTS